MRGWELGLRPAARAESLLYVAKHYSALGWRKKAAHAISVAVATEPTRKESYADGLAQLVTRGYGPEALDLYRKAMTRPEMSGIFASVLHVLDRGHDPAGTYGT